jgi:oxygen-independent coproporphyrinogen-3 oxidase
MEEALALQPGHVSAYALTVEEGTPLCRLIAEGKALPVDEDRQESIRESLHQVLVQKGYECYEISNYALPGKQCAHNAAYWNLKPYLGIGPAAVSTLPSETGPVRLTGIRDIKAYTENPLTPEIERISPRDFLADYLLMGLRTAAGIDVNEFLCVFGLDFSENFSQSVCKNRQFILKNAEKTNIFTLNDKGRRFLNAVLLDFLEELDTFDYAKTPAWP